MRLDLATFLDSLFHDGPLTSVVAVGAAALLTRASRQARTLGAVLVGLLVYGVLWRVLAEILLDLFNGSSPGGVSDGNHAAYGMMWTGWRLVGNLGDAAAVVVLAWAVAKPRLPAGAATGDAARDVPPSERAGPHEPGVTPGEIAMSKKNHSPGPVPPGNRPGGEDKAHPDTGAEHAPPQDGTGFAEEDPQRRLGGFTGKGEHSIQQPTPRQDGDAKAK